MAPALLMEQYVASATRTETADVTTKRFVDEYTKGAQAMTKFSTLLVSTFLLTGVACAGEAVSQRSTAVQEHSSRTTTETSDPGALSPAGDNDTSQVETQKNSSYTSHTDSLGNVTAEKK